ncbi:MAG: hypothetical protein JOZ93_08595 [Sinobacteraceae bacterium]|nr:hypothetical protein [Nevskiaceae bacterium]
MKRSAASSDYANILADGTLQPMRQPLLIPATILLLRPLWFVPPAVAGPPAAATAEFGNPLTNPERQHGCLPGGNGYLRARIRGALQLDINLHNAELECDGGARPDGSGIRVSFAGPVRTDGRRLRMVFGVASATEGQQGQALRTNLTVIFEGEQKVFATRGDDKCTVDELTQERLGAPGGSRRAYRIIARGFCIVPIRSLQGTGEIVVNSFDFAGNVTFEDHADETAPAGAAQHTARH